MLEYIIAFLLWLLVFIPSSTLASIIVQKNRKAAGFAIQSSFIAFSLLLMFFLRVPINFSPSRLPETFLGGFLLSLVLNIIWKLFGVEMNPPDLPEGKLELFFLLLVIAPIGEETLYRGLLEGYLLSSGVFWGAVISSAALFAFPHWMAFEGNSSGRALAVSGVFLVGLSVGYLFAITRSLLTAFLFHSAANLTGLVVGGLEKKLG
ncbi:CPBP family intramembrane glutamic endopeptidase [Thermococcus sp. Bubb.Bath]|uniref:CPBP family intramembrane glutamic endopeptidase n=1 Tax=Thermococcus sp. Bubb.Bath TaxID=1638242 RepID=UPI00143BB19F|nr:CPBP family intramembrane glutamic endopeptidase [Thermococcus sp. Bubb.Bath]NJF25021.1 CPBP family intramembrane metalloprotease [Thermococcus sp. Bubb.Bath]